MASTIFMGNGGGGGDVEKALRKIVKDEVRKEQLKYDLLAQEREAEHTKQLQDLEEKLLKQSEIKQAELELELKKQATKNEKALQEQKALQEAQKYSHRAARGVPK
ncbi:Oidioi.mRNA.OKI2018_I69.XSR.g15391.t1.cds [Oikopleura dioica]|uniref:Oidioi.mRNA.OKI2018_I69.XSR.g15391.t1.cds n=1 Tax=Oikopleura dioica TaxID=34765 RepID=A0ABN7SCQ9_OIKDI|nr:Oidioi.mRNA.OKI2018_I69.XSR.g15391.t1.cds [Oikopleura dioica]